jgi:hypothetical protein
MLLAILCIDQKVKRVRDSDVAQNDINVGWSRPSRVNNSSTDFDSCTVSQIIRGLSPTPYPRRVGSTFIHLIEEPRSSRGLGEALDALRQ